MTVPTTSSSIKYLVLSDIHLGNNNNKATFIIKNIDEFFEHYTNRSRFCDLDMLAIAGDLFDRLLDFSSPYIHDIILCLDRLMSFCERENIIFRILKGTPSHDREQAEITSTIYKMRYQEKGKLNFRYVDTLYIEHIDELGLDVLYVPDEWTALPEQTLDQFKVLLKEKGLEQVDIALMHGAFAYQLPFAPNTVPKHDEVAYLSLVKRFINIGHVHEFSVFERIVAQGSFDRINHGSEVEKGATLMYLDPEGDHFEFIENKNARIFKTIELKHKDVDRSLKQVEREVSKYPDDSYIRIKTTSDHPLYRAFDELKLHFPMMNFSKITKEDEKDQYEIVSNVVTLDTSYTPINIHRDNIVGLLTDTILNKYSLSSRQQEILQRGLNKVKMMF